MLSNPYERDASSVSARPSVFLRVPEKSFFHLRQVLFGRVCKTLNSDHVSLRATDSSLSRRLEPRLLSHINRDLNGFTCIFGHRQKLVSSVKGDGNGGKDSKAVEGLTDVLGSSKSLGDGPLLVLKDRRQERLYERV